MFNLRLYDQNFVGDAGCSRYRAPSELTWLREGPDTPVTVYTDRLLHMAPTAKSNIRRVAWILEPEAISIDPYRFIEHQYHHFDIILTHHSKLLSIDKKFTLYPNGMTWIAEADWKKHLKTREVSIISSEKKHTDGHRLRHSVIEKAGSSMDVYGRGYVPVEHKVAALGPYRFSVVIENTRVDGWYFTEKIVDCFATHTVPIYWGSPRISEFFDTSGIIIANSQDSILDAIEMVKAGGEDLYASMADAMQRNHTKAASVAVAEDWIVKNVLLPRGLLA